MANSLVWSMDLKALVKSITSRKTVIKSTKHQQNFVDLGTVSSIFTVFC